MTLPLGVQAQVADSVPSSPATGAEPTQSGVAPTPPVSPQSPALSLDPTKLEEARRRIESGLSLFGSGDYSGALAEYERAYALIPGHPLQHRALFNIAKCYEKLFRYNKALAYYQRYLEEGGPQAEKKLEVQQTIEFLTDRLATLHLDVNTRAQVWIDGSLVGDAPGDVLLEAGRHTVELRAAGHEPRILEVQIAARQRQQRSIELEALSPVAGASPGWFWASTAVTGAALATGTVLGIIAVSESSTLHDQLAPTNVERWRADPAAGKRVRYLALAADISFGAAALFGVTSLALYFVTDWHDEHNPGTGNVRSARVVPWAGPQGAGVSMQGNL